MSTAGYSGTPLPRKLGIREGSRVLLVDAPDDLRAVLAEPGAELVPERARDLDVALVFVTEMASLRLQFPALADALAPAGGLWVAWPKRASGVATDLDENRVREVGLAGGLVDNKVCAIDAIWSGLRCVRRLRDRPPRAGRALSG